MGWTCRTYTRGKKHRRKFGRKTSCNMDHSGDRNEDCNIILKRILRKQMIMWTGFIWLRTGSGGGLWCSRCRTFWFCYRRAFPLESQPTGCNAFLWPGTFHCVRLPRNRRVERYGVCCCPASAANGSILTVEFCCAWNDSYKKQFETLLSGFCFLLLHINMLQTLELQCTRHCTVK